MPQPASIEADEYSRWDDDDLVGSGFEAVGPRAANTPSNDLASTTLLAGVEATGGRLDKWLAARMTTYSRSRIQRWIDDGHVTVDGRVAGIRDAVYKGDRVVVAPQPSEAEGAYIAEDVALDIVFEDDTLLMLDKRAGLVVHPAAGNWTGTVLNGLLHHRPASASIPRAGIVHRLDKDTSGLMVVAKTLSAQTDLVRQLQARTVGRTYVAIVHGTPPASGRVDWPIGRDPRERTKMAASKPSAQQERPGAKPAATRFETLATVDVARGRTASLMICRLETGRTHQIRVHMHAIGHPLVGDATYGGAHPALPFTRQALHAWRLGLIHPDTQASMRWQAAPPNDLRTLATDIGLDLDALLLARDADG